MSGVPGYSFVCQKCNNELVLNRLELEKFAVSPCKFCSPLTSLVSTSLAAPPKNLLYHVTPLANYKWNLEQLFKRIHMFDGRLVFAIATGDNLDPYPETCNYITSLYKNATKIVKLEFKPIRNHPELRETHSLATLLLEASEFDRSGYTFYAHTKGVTRGDNPAVTLWTDAMYHYNLDYIDKVDQSLKKFPVTGCCKRRGKFANFPKGSVWHYSGTYFWFRNKDLFEKNWPQVNQSRYGAEAYLSLLFPDEAAGCLWGDRFQNGYDWTYIKSLVKNDDYFANFLSENIDHNPDRGSPRKLRAVPSVGKAPNQARR